MAEVVGIDNLIKKWKREIAQEDRINRRSKEYKRLIKKCGKCKILD